MSEHYKKLYQHTFFVETKEIQVIHMVSIKRITHIMH